MKSTERRELYRLRDGERDRRRDGEGEKEGWSVRGERWREG